jgi:hypothetical protein
MASTYVLQMRIGKDSWVNMKTITGEHAAVITRNDYREWMEYKVDFRLIRLGY